MIWKLMAKLFLTTFLAYVVWHCWTVMKYRQPVIIPAVLQNGVTISALTTIFYYIDKLP